MGASSSTPGACIDGSSATYAGRTCTMQCGVDYGGGDYKYIGANTFLDCLQACAGDTQCTDASYVEQNNVCYMKSTLTTAQNATGVDAAVCVVQSSAQSTVTDFITTTQYSTATTTVTSSTTIPTTVTSVSSTTTTEMSTLTSSVTATYNYTTTIFETNTITNNYTTTVVVSQSYSSPAPSTVMINNTVTSTLTVASSTPTCPYASEVNANLPNYGFESGLDNWSYLVNHGSFTKRIVTGLAPEGCKYFEVTPQAPIAGYNFTFGSMINLPYQNNHFNLNYGGYANQSLPQSMRFSVWMNGIYCGTMTGCPSSSCGNSYGGINWSYLEVPLPRIPGPSGITVYGMNLVSWTRTTGYLQIAVEWAETDAGNSSIVFDNLSVSSTK